MIAQDRQHRIDADTFSVIVRSFLRQVVLGAVRDVIEKRGMKLGDDFWTQYAKDSLQWVAFTDAQLGDLIAAAKAGVLP